MYTNPNLYQNQIDTLQAQIDRIRGLTQHQSAPLPITPTQYNNDMEQIRNLVRQEMNSMFPQNIPAQEIQQTPLSPQEQLMKDINDLASSILSPDDLKFMNNPDMVKCVPVFLKTERGKQAVSLLMEEYRSYIEGK